ncbi:hypothetical protein ACJVC5_07930 [Peredibacter sp. HCB2-198]|uniref:hypothetical protein n=1 Tax=Peredibacter sp. HCB2-198 TaxID=3383025 RepID=UPI0038B67A04
MKNKFIMALALLVSGAALAENGPQFTVLVRRDGRSTKPYYTKMEMPDLESNNSFDGKYFKIVKSKGKEAVSFDEKDEKLLLKAANVYYHLNKARQYWVDQVKSEHAASLPKITIRLEIFNQFDELGHFANDNRAPQYNNALSVPAGETPSWVPAEKQDKWEKEIWFRPMKSIPAKDLAPSGPNPLTTSLNALERPLINYTANSFNQTLMEHMFYPTYAARPLHEDVLRLVGTIAMTKAIIYASKYADPLFMDKYYYLETAMIPEIVYHEYSHLVLSDHLQMSHSTPVNEGMADYFAAVMSDKRKVYAKVKGYSNSAPKDTQNKRPYSHWDESNRAATADFTLSVLWDVRETLGEEIGDKVVYAARTFLKTETATVSDSLLRSILKACDLKCESPRKDKLKLYETFSKKGF